jgi:hypothetical protein
MRCRRMKTYNMRCRRMKTYRRINPGQRRRVRLSVSLSKIHLKIIQTMTYFQESHMISIY